MQFALGYKSIWTVNHRNQFNWDSVAFRTLLQTWFKRPKYGWKKCSVIIVPKTKNLSSEWIRCAIFSFSATHCNEITMKWDYQPVVILSIRCLHRKKIRSIAFRTRIFGKVVKSCVSTLTHGLNVWIRMHITLIQFSHEHKSHPVAVSKFAFEIPCKHHCEYYRAKRVPVKMRAHFLMVRKRWVFSKQTSFH